MDPKKRKRRQSATPEPPADPTGDASSTAPRQRDNKLQRTRSPSKEKEKNDDVVVVNQPYVRKPPKELPTGPGNGRYRFRTMKEAQLHFYRQTTGRFIAENQHFFPKGHLHEAPPPHSKPKPKPRQGGAAAAGPPRFPEDRLLRVKDLMIDNGTGYDDDEDDYSDEEPKKRSRFAMFRPPGSGSLSPSCYVATQFAAPDEVPPPSNEVDGSSDEDDEGGVRLNPDRALPSIEMDGGSDEEEAEDDKPGEQDSEVGAESEAEEEEGDNDEFSSGEEVLTTRWMMKARSI